MTVGVQLPTQIMNGNPSVGVPLTSVERSSFIDVGMTKVRTVVWRHNCIVGAVFHANIL